MNGIYHILNGDALKEQFPSTLKGKIIIAKECLVDGNVQGTTLKKLFKSRARFISTFYNNYTEKDYYEKTASEIVKIKDIPTGSEVNLWFEDDLFCQVNLWFVINLLQKVKNRNYTIYLIRPEHHSEYGFGGLSSDELITIYTNKTSIEISELKLLSKLWNFYQDNSIERMVVIGKELDDKFPFLIPVIEAHIARIPGDGKLGRPTETLIRLMGELKTTEFVPVFRAFCKQESIYGFGDLQVKRLFDKILYSQKQRL